MTQPVAVSEPKQRRRAAFDVNHAIRTFNRLPLDEETIRNIRESGVVPLTVACTLTQLGYWAVKALILYGRLEGYKRDGRWVVELDSLAQYLANIPIPPAS